MEGYDVARAMRGSAITKDIFIVAVSGYDRDADRAKSKAAGIDVHMGKPIELEALLEEIAKSRGKRRR